MAQPGPRGNRIAVVAAGQAGPREPLDATELAQVDPRPLEDELIQSGLLRHIEFRERPPGATRLTFAEFSSLGLVETTNLGNRQLAGWLGLGSAAAARYHGLSGNGRGAAGRRWRSLRALAHSLGANDVFVAFCRGCGWRETDRGRRRIGGVAVSSRVRAAPLQAGRYGCYVRNGIAQGFFLEYDRGTGSARRYAAKFRAYYRYRDSGHAGRDYLGFPTLLFVTTDASAEHRIAEQTDRASFIRGLEPLTVLITTTNRIDMDREGVLGRIWRRAPVDGSSVHDRLEGWQPEGTNGTATPAWRRRLSQQDDAGVQGGFGCAN